MALPPRPNRLRELGQLCQSVSLCHPIFRGTGRGTKNPSSGERLGTGQTEDVVDAVVLAPRHRLRPSIVPVATVLVRTIR